MTHRQNIARILNTPGMRGELAIQLDNKARCIVPFRSWGHRTGGGKISIVCVMGSQQLIVSSYFPAAGIKLFENGIADGWATQIIPYRCVQLIWCHYPGKEGAE